MSIRRSTASIVSAALVALGLIVVPSSTATVSAAGETAQLPTDNPANFTPNVLNGKVDSIWQVGNTVIIGGTFTQVANSTQNGGTVYNRTNIAAFDATTGVVNPNFAPVLSSYVTSVISAGDGTSIYVGGDFNTVNGVNRRKVARINLSNGSLVTTFNANGVNGVVRDMRLTGGNLLISGLFATVGGQSRTRLASLNPSTGALTTKVNLPISGTWDGGTTNVIKMDVNPAGTRLMMLGNFTSVAGQTRNQIAMVDLSTDPATVSPWSTNFYTSVCASAFDSYVQDLDISEDGAFAVVTTTGAYRANSSCDTDARFEIINETLVAPTWVNVTGGDTSYAVEIRNGVAFIGGHMRWANNPSAADQAGQGAVPREGMMALDVVTGLPFSWNPGRERGVGLFDFHVTDAGLWAGSDTDRWNNELRQKLAFFPWAGGSLVPASGIGALPNDVFLLGRTSGTTGTNDPSVLYRINAGGPTLASADDGPDWAADTSSTSAYRNSGSSTASYTLTAGTLDASVPKSDTDRPPAGIFNTERYDPATGSEMQWNFNVTAGTPIQVRLYMANKSTGTDEVGQRVFDVDLDGVNVIDNIDLTQLPGHNIGTMRSFNIVSDGQVNILFRHGVENPLINAIEIVRTDVSNTGTYGTQDEVQRVVGYTGTTNPAAPTVLAGTSPWKQVRGSFMVNSTLYTLHADGTLVRRSFDGTTFGPAVATNTYANGILSEVTSMTGVFFEPSTSRIYYTLSGQSSLYYRSFLPESHVIGATRYSATGDIANLNPSRVRGMFLAGGQIWFGDNTTGNLLNIGFANGVAIGAATVANNTLDWRARAMFLMNQAQPNVPPVAAFTSNCAVNSCTFDGSTSTDSDGTITGYAWDFGDGQIGTGVDPVHGYAVGGTYTVTLTVTDSNNDTHSVQHDVTVVDPPNVAPTASFTSLCTLLDCTFTSTSTDADGTIASYAWDFGDGQVGTGSSAVHSYAAPGTYTVGLTVLDDDGAPGTTSSSVTVVDASAAAVFRAANSSIGSTATASVVVPAAVQAGDQLVLVVTANTATTTTTPSGWTLLGTQSDGSPDMRSWVFTRTAVAGTAGSTVSATLGAISKSATVVMAYSNAQVPSVLASSTMVTSSTALATPAVAVATSGSAVVNYWADKSSGNTGWVLPGTVTARRSAIGTGSGRITAAAGDVIVTGTSWPGATANSTVAGAKGIGWSIVVPAVAAPLPNVPPTAAFTSSCTSLTCNFDASTSTDGDGSIVSYAWDFSGGQVGSGVTASNTFPADGTYAVSLTVTDDDGAPTIVNGQVTVAVVNANVAFRAASQVNTTATNASITVPATVVAGDQLVLFVTSNVATTITTPAGWTLLDTQSDGTPDLRSWVFTRTADASSAGSTVTPMLGASAKASRVLVAYSGAEAVTVVASSVMGASSTALASPAVSVAENGSVVVGYWSDKSGGNTGWTLPAQITGRVSSLGTGAGQVTAAAGDAVAAAGTFPGATATSSIAGTKGIALSVVIAPI